MTAPRPQAMGGSTAERRRRPGDVCSRGREPRLPPHAWLLLRPRAIAANLERARKAGLVDQPPSHWQIVLGVARMWHRLVFRSETIGQSRADPVRSTVRARLLAPRVVRFPFLLAERAVAPLDFSGLASSPERIIRHLLAAHHDGQQMVYDLELLSPHPGALETLRDEIRSVVEGSSPRARWLRDLTVFEGYHERLLAAVEDAVAHGLRLGEPEARDPDISLSGYLRWCARQPRTPAETWAALRARRWTLG